MAHGSWLTRRAVFSAFAYNPRYGVAQDLELLLRLDAAGRRIGKLMCPLYAYSLSPVNPKCYEQFLASLHLRGHKALHRVCTSSWGQRLVGGLYRVADALERKGRARRSRVAAVVWRVLSVAVCPVQLVNVVDRIWGFRSEER